MSGLRVSDSERYLGLVPQYNLLLAQQLEVQRQISSQDRFARADQDPGTVTLAERLDTENARLTQDLRNIDQLRGQAQVTESALTNAVDSFQRAQELSISAGDATKSDTDLQAMAQEEVDQILRNLVDLANQKYRGQALFSGSQAGALPFQVVTDASGKITGVNYVGNGESLSAETAPGDPLTYNLLGSNETGGSSGVFRDTTAGVDLFGSLITFRDDLLSGNRAGITADAQQLSAGSAHLTAVGARLGGIENRLDALTAFHQDTSDQLAATISHLTNTDIAAAATQLSALQTSYQAALAVGARLSNISLLQYLTP